MTCNTCGCPITPGQPAVESWVLSNPHGGPMTHHIPCLEVMYTQEGPAAAGCGYIIRRIDTSPRHQQIRQQTRK